MTTLREYLARLDKDSLASAALSGPHSEEVNWVAQEAFNRDLAARVWIHLGEPTEAADAVIEAAENAVIHTVRPDP